MYNFFAVVFFKFYLLKKCVILRLLYSFTIKDNFDEHSYVCVNCWTPFAQLYIFYTIHVSQNWKLVYLKCNFFKVPTFLVLFFICIYITNGFTVSDLLSKFSLRQPPEFNFELKTSKLWKILQNVQTKHVVFKFIIQRITYSLIHSKTKDCITM